MLDVFMLTFGEPEANDNFLTYKPLLHMLNVLTALRVCLTHTKPVLKSHALNIFMYVMLVLTYNHSFSSELEPSSRKEAYPGV